MKGMLAVPALLLALALAPAVPATALDWGLGTDLGLTVFAPDYEDAEGVALLGWPTVTSVYQVGGLRVSFALADPRHEIWVGTSYAFMETGGRSQHETLLSANYQFNFSTGEGFVPYLTAGVGMNNAGMSHHGSRSATGMLFGAGVGLSHRVTGGAGRLRGELRYDRQTEGEFEEGYLIPQGSAFGLKLGFDLWIR